MTRLLPLVGLLAGCITAPPDAQPRRDTGAETDLGIVDLGVTPDARDLSTVEQDRDGGDVAPDLGNDVGRDVASPVAASPVVSRLDALWLFEMDAPEADSIGTHALTTVAGAFRDSTNAVEGAGLLSLQAGETATIDPAARLGASVPDSTVVVGGWFRENSSGTSSTLLSLYQGGGGGWAMAIQPNETSPSCVVHSATEGDQWMASSVPIARAEWNHYVCMLQADAAGLVNTTMFINGEVVAEGVDQAVTAAASTVPFQIGSIGTLSYRFDGEVDEVFVAQQAVEPRAIRKLWSCGANGERCLCDPVNTNEYVDCGLIADCSRLPSCR